MGGVHLWKNAIREVEEYRSCRTSPAWDRTRKTKNLSQRGVRNDEKVLGPPSGK